MTHPTPKAFLPKVRGPVATGRKSCWLRFRRGADGADEHKPSQQARPVRRLLAFVSAVWSHCDDLHDWYRVPLEGTRTVHSVRCTVAGQGFASNSTEYDGVDDPQCVGPFYGVGVHAIHGCGSGDAGTVPAKRNSAKRAAARGVIAAGGPHDLLTRLFPDKPGVLYAFTAMPARPEADMPEAWSGNAAANVTADVWLELPNGRRMPPGTVIAFRSVELTFALWRRLRSRYPWFPEVAHTVMDDGTAEQKYTLERWIVQHGAAQPT